VHPDGRYDAERTYEVKSKRNRRSVPHGLYIERDLLGYFQSAKVQTFRSELTSMTPSKPILSAEKPASFAVPISTASKVESGLIAPGLASRSLV